MKSNVNVSMNMTIMSVSTGLCRCVFVYSRNHVNDSTQMTGKIKIFSLDLMPHKHFMKYIMAKKVDVHSLYLDSYLLVTFLTFKINIIDSFLNAS